MSSVDLVQDVNDAKTHRVSQGRGGGAGLTPSIASFTRSCFTSPILNRFSINSVLVDPEQYHAIVNGLVCRHVDA